MIIAFTGAATAGKSTATNALAPIPWFHVKNYMRLSRFWVRLPLAGVLKEMLACIDPLLLEPEVKEMPADVLCGKTPRYAMRTIGTDWGRDTIGEEIWIRAWKRRADIVQHRGGDIVVDDVRFQNEYEMLTQLGAHIVEIERPGVVRSGTHASEAWRPPEAHIIVNDSDIETLYMKVRDLVEELENEA